MVQIKDIHPSEVLELPYMTLFTVRSTTDCTNGGVTAKFDMFTVCQTAEIAKERIEAGLNPDEVLYLDFKHDRVACYPAAKLTNGKWYMDGGNYVTSCDSRCRFRYPIPVHDRTE